MSNLPGLPTIIQMDLNDLVTGSLIGSGSFREVYHCRLVPDTVLKIMKQGGGDDADTRAGEFANVVEWRVWQALQCLSIRRFFAPCLDISPCGQVLVMPYCPPLKPEEWPKRFPDVLMDDLRDGNLGLYDGRPVLIDYGRNSILERGLDCAKLVKAKKKDWQYATVKSR